MRELKYWQAINEALFEEMGRDERVTLAGEDVAQPGGPFGASRGLLEKFGPWRVKDTPISEAAIAGLAVGAALAGLRPVVEIMFLDFMALAMDQIVNQAAKTRYMSGGRLSLPMTIRMLCGAGRNNGPQHSQSLEAWLCHVPGLKVVWPSTPAEAKGLLKSAIRDDDPVIVIDSLNLWTSRGPVPDGDHLTPIGKADVKRSGADVTIVAVGCMVHRALGAAERLAAQEIDAEVLDLNALAARSRRDPPLGYEDASARDRPRRREALRLRRGDRRDGGRGGAGGAGRAPEAGGPAIHARPVQPLPRERLLPAGRGDRGGGEVGPRAGLSERWRSSCACPRSE